MLIPASILGTLTALGLYKNRLESALDAPGETRRPGPGVSGGNERRTSKSGGTVALKPHMYFMDKTHAGFQLDKKTSTSLFEHFKSAFPDVSLGYDEN